MQMNIGDHPGIAVDFASGGLDGNAGEFDKSHFKITHLNCYNFHF